MESKSISVMNLVAKRISPLDEWKLALVQRHPVWDEIRIARLLDSLLRNYPIGMLLVCRLKSESRVLEPQGETRIAVPADPYAWQLIDGQQRINALATLFTDEGRFGSFFIDMTSPLERAGVSTRKRDRRSAIRYIVWRDKFGHLPELDDENRGRYLDLSHWYKWADKQGKEGLKAISQRIKSNPEECISILNSIDDEFADDLDKEQLNNAASLTERLLRVWTDESIPVQYLELDDAEDVLQVFTRSNLEGVRIDGEDVFFAAIKTRWNEAEQYLDRVAGPLVNQMTALRILARLASLVTDGSDLLPLRADRLNGQEGDEIKMILVQLADSESVAKARIKHLEQVLISRSRLGYGLRMIYPRLLDEVFAWAMVNPRTLEDGYIAKQLSLLETYLVGAHSFGYTTVFREAFSKLAFLEAVRAGMDATPFPLERIVAAVKGTWKEMKSGRRSVQSLEKENDQLDYVDNNDTFFLSILQNLPFVMPLITDANPRGITRVVEWDHIYPQALAREMRYRDDNNKYRYFPHHQFVWRAGNLWALDRPLNNYARDKRPTEKLEILKDPTKVGASLPSRWPLEESAFLTEEEKNLLLEADRLLMKKHLSTGAQQFGRFAKGRSLRIFNEIISLYPKLSKFSRTDESEAIYEAPGPLSGQQVADALKVTFINTLPEEVIEPGFDSSGGDEKSERILDLAEENGLLDELNLIVLKSREAGLYVRPYKRTFMMTPLDNRTRMIFRITPGGRTEGRFLLYLSSEAIHEFFPEISIKRALELGPDEWSEISKIEAVQFARRLEDVFASRIKRPTTIG